MEWDETEREWIIALQTYENQHICPLCGMDRDFCHDYKKVHDVFYNAEVDTCFISEMREQALDAYYKKDGPGSKHSQLTHLNPYQIEIKE